MIPGYRLCLSFLAPAVVSDCTASSTALSKTHSAHARAFPSTLSRLAPLTKATSAEAGANSRLRDPTFDCTLDET